MISLPSLRLISSPDSIIGQVSFRTAASENIYLPIFRGYNEVFLFIVELSVRMLHRLNCANSCDAVGKLLTILVGVGKYI